MESEKNTAVVTVLGKDRDGINCANALALALINGAK